MSGLTRASVRRQLRASARVTSAGTPTLMDPPDRIWASFCRTGAHLDHAAVTGVFGGTDVRIFTMGRIDVLSPQTVVWCTGFRPDYQLDRLPSGRQGRLTGDEDAGGERA
jgi:hypothetical protein